MCLKTRNCVWRGGYVHTVLNCARLHGRNKTSIPSDIEIMQDWNITRKGLSQREVARWVQVTR